MWGEQAESGNSMEEPVMGETKGREYGRMEAGGTSVGQRLEGRLRL